MYLRVSFLIVYNLVVLMESTSQKLIKEFRPFKTIFLAAFSAMAISGFLSILPSWFVKVSIDGLGALDKNQKQFSILPRQIIENIDSINGFLNKLSIPSLDLTRLTLPSEKLFIILPIAIIAVFFVEASAKFLYQYLARLLGLKVVKSMREKYHRHINLLAMKEHKNIDSGSLLSVVSSDLQSLQSWLAESLMNLFSESFKAIFLFAWLLALNWKLTLISAVVLPLFAIPVIKLGKGIRNYAKKGQDFVGSISSFVSETLRNQSIIKAFNLEKWRDKKFIDESNAIYNLFKKWILYMALVSPVTNIVGAFGIAAILFFGLKSVTNGYFTVGEFSSFFVTSLLLYDPVKRLGRVSTIFQSALGVADRVYSLLSLPIQKDKKVDTPLTTTNIQGELEFKDIHFSYGDKKIFNNLNLSVPAKTSLALVGPSGGGKSSLVSLIPRFFEIQSGSIKIDAINIKSMTLLELRSLIAMVTQEPLLFTASIKENILLGLNPNRKYTSHEIQEKLNKALEDSFVSEFIDDLEGGLEFNIGEAGSKLSIGQKQRISLARAFISDSPIIILDEPTSALDNESQEMVYQAIERLKQDRTVVIIAHRLSTIKSCDKIVYLEHGQILEEGSHDSLIASGQSYANLARETN